MNVNKKLLRRFIGLLLTALLLISVFVLAATTAARGSTIREVVGGSSFAPANSNWMVNALG